MKSYTIRDLARISNNGERAIVGNWEKAKSTSHSAGDLAHLQRYEWVAPMVEGLSYLDFGCGTAYGADYLTYTRDAKSAVVIDNSQDGIMFAADRYSDNDSLYVILGDCLFAPFKSRIFDAVVSFDVLEHIADENQDKFVSEASRVLKDDGVLYIGCPNKELSWGNNPFHLHELTLTEFRNLLEKHFLSVKTLGQDVLMEQGRAKRDFKAHYFTDYENMVIVTEDVKDCFGMLAICREKK